MSLPTRTPDCHPPGCGLSTLKAVVVVVKWQNTIMRSLKDQKIQKKYAKKQIQKTLKNKSHEKKSKFYSFNNTLYY